MDGGDKLPYKKDTTDPITRVIRSYLTTTDVARLLNVSRPTALAKIRDPDRMTVGELRTLNKFGHIPKNKLKEVI